MAPALSSGHAFHLVVGSPHSRSQSRTARPNVAVHASQNRFGLGKQKAEEPLESGETKSESTNKSRPFFFDNVPDAKSLIPVLGSSSTLFAGPRRRKDPNTIFVAGATGQSGARITQMLLRQGFAVRAGVPELASAQELARIAATYKLISPAESKRLNAVVSSFSDPDAIAKAIGPAAKAVVAIGPSENGPDAAVTTDDALRLVLAAQLSGVYHVAIVYNSTPSSSPTNNVLDGITSFFSNLFPNSQNKQLSLSDFLDKVVESDISGYTLLKAALTEDYSAESEHAVVVAEEGSATLGENKVSKSQIAKLVADVFSNTSVTENKVVQVSTSPSAAPKPISELFSAIPEDGRRKAYAEAIAKAKAEEEEALVASEEARKAAEAAKKLEKEVKKLSEQEGEAASSFAKEARTKVEAAAGFTLDNLLSKAKDFGDGGVGTANFSWKKLSSQLATAVSPKADGGKPMMQVATIRGQVKARNLPPQSAVVKQTAAPKSRPKKPEPKPKAKQPETKTEVRSVLGGLFKQETIYVDDD